MEASSISDVGLPDGNGTDIIRYLRTTQPIRGIAISGFGMDSDIRKSLEAGFSEHLVKPVKLEKLEAAIARAERASGKARKNQLTQLASRLTADAASAATTNQDLVM